MLVDNQRLFFSVCCWGVVFFIFSVMYGVRSIKSSGLTFVFISDLAINHFFGALIYLFPWYVPEHRYILSYTPEIVTEGFFQTTLGLLGFLCGNIFVYCLYGHNKRLDQRQTSEQMSNLASKLIIIGLTFYFILRPILRFLGLGTISQAGWGMIQIGVCLALLSCFRRKEKIRFILWLLSGIIFFPAFTLIAQGFMSYAIRAILIIFCFVGVFYRPKWKLMVVAPFALYFGLTFFSNYMQAREQIREAVWEGAALADRIKVTKLIFKDMSFFDYRESRQLEVIDVRLNQNVFVGWSVDYLSAGYKEFAQGKTLYGALLAMVPRVVWPNKPIIGGSGSLVSDYTGKAFDEESSFGVGFPLELYINYGTQGVIVGFFVLGVIIGWYDRSAGVALDANNIRRFLFLFFPALALTNTLGSLSEATSSVAIAYAFLFLLDKLHLNRYDSRNQEKNAKPVAAIKDNSIDRGTRFL